MTSGNLSTGEETLSSHGLNFRSYYYWISLGALFGFTVIFNVGFILSLTYLNRKLFFYVRLINLQRGVCEKNHINLFNVVLYMMLAPGTARAVITYEKLQKLQQDEDSNDGETLVLLRHA